MPWGGGHSFIKKAAEKEGREKKPERDGSDARSCDASSTIVLRAAEALSLFPEVYGLVI